MVIYPEIRIRFGYSKLEFDSKYLQILMLKHFFHSQYQSFVRRIKQIINYYSRD